MEFCPGVYEHAAAVIGRTPWEVSRSTDLLVDAHLRSWELYGHRLLAVGIDVYNVEPEALGATVSKPAGPGVPAITSHPLGGTEEIHSLPAFDPYAGRISQVLAAASRLSHACPNAEVRVPVCGPLALANGLMGMENLLIDIIENEAAARENLMSLVKLQVEFLKAIRDTGVRPIIFESGVTPPLLPARLFAAVEAPLLKMLFGSAKEIFGERPPCIVGGDSAPVIRDLLTSGPGYVIAPSETDQERFFLNAREFPEVHVRVNLPSRTVFHSSLEEMKFSAEAAFQIASTRNNTSIGCGVVPYEASPEMVLALGRLVNDL